MRYAGFANRGPSVNIWGDIGKWRADNASGRCGFFFDDFLPAPYIAATGASGNWYAYIDTSNLVTGVAAATLADGAMGVVDLYHDATDNDSPAMQFASMVTGAPFKISDTAGEDFKLAFECRFAVDSVVDDVNSIFLGLGEEAFAANDCKVDDTGVMADKDFIGFDSVHTNGGTTGTNAILTFRYKKNGQTQQTKIATLQTMVASTWYKVGFVIDPSADTTKRGKVFLNGAEQTTYVTGTNIATATFPDGEEVGPVLINKAGTGTAGHLYLDWVCVGQYCDDSNLTG